MFKSNYFEIPGISCTTIADTISTQDISADDCISLQQLKLEYEQYVELKLNNLLDFREFIDNSGRSDLCKILDK